MPEDRLPVVIAVLRACGDAYTLAEREMGKARNAAKASGRSLPPDLKRIVSGLASILQDVCREQAALGKSDEDRLYAVFGEVLRALLSAADWCEAAECDADVDGFARSLARLAAAIAVVDGGNEDRDAYAKHIMALICETAGERAICGVVLDRKTGKLDWGWLRRDANQGKEHI